MWAEPNRVVYWDACAESRSPKGGATVRWQPSTLYGMFVQPFYFVSYYFYWIEYDDYRRPIIASSGRDMVTIRWPIRISIRICGWRLDRPVDPIKIWCTGSPTLRPRTCRRPVVSQPLGAPNQYRAPNLRSLWPWSNTRLISPRNTRNYRWIMNNFAKWSWTWHHRVVIHVCLLLFGRITTSLLLLLLLQLHH